MKKIIIEVSGGMVQAVYSDDYHIEVEVLDYDNMNSEYCEAEERNYYESLKAEIDSGELHSIY